MKAMILVLSPEECVNLLNGDLSVLVRKKFPKDFVGWVYIYCTKVPLSKQNWLLDKDNKGNLQDPYGKVVTRFWCSKWCSGVEEIKTKLTALGYVPYTKTLSMPDLLENSCLTIKDLDDYLQGKNGYAIHIIKLEIFDKPKEISEFKYIKRVIGCENGYGFDRKELRPLTRAPSNYCYVEAK